MKREKKLKLSRKLKKLRLRRLLMKMMREFQN